MIFCKKNKNIKSYILLFIITIIISIPFLNPNFDMKQGDGILHISRLMGTYQAILDGQKIPNIMINFCNGFGYNWNTFYSPLTVYLPLLFKLFISSFSLCLKIFMISTVYISGLFMFEFVKDITNSHKIAVIAGIIYITMPYRLTDMYIRIAVSELAAFMFFPLIFLGLSNILNKRINVLYFSIGAIGLILTHNISVIIATLFGILYLLINIKKIDRSVIKILFINTIFIIAITCIFWVPMLEAIVSSQYEVFIPDRMGSVESIKKNGIKFSQLIYTNCSDDFIFEVGMPNLIILISSIYCIKNVKKEYRNIYISFLIFGILSLFMATQYYPWNIMPSFLGIIQFPWRMIAFGGFFLTFVFSINILILISNFKNIYFYLNIVILTCYTTILIPHLKYDNTFKEMDYWNGEKVSLDKGKISSDCSSYEYLPENAQNNREYISKRNDKAVILDGNVKIVNQVKQGTYMKIYISDAEESSNIELPYIYYPGYQAKIITKDGEKILDTIETDHGLVGVFIPKNKDVLLEIRYDGTFLMKVSVIISIISIFLYFFYLKNIRKSININ